MTNLPNTKDPSASSSVQYQPTGSMTKEQEFSPFSPSELPLQDLGKEFDLPKEVQAAGVKTTPTTVSVPPPVANLGVKPSSAVAPSSSNKTPSLPLSDVQIADGLHANISSSFRWLAEWCRYKLKKLGLLQ